MNARLGSGNPVLKTHQALALPAMLTDKHETGDSLCAKRHMLCSQCNYGIAFIFIMLFGVVCITFVALLNVIDTPRPLDILSY